MEKDVVVIGGGPAGYAAAIRTAQMGGTSLLIEKNNLGGTCLNEGCIPTKVLYRNAEILKTLKNIENFGIHVDGYSIDIEKIQERKNNVIDKLRNGILQLLKKNKVEVLYGIGKIQDKNTVEVILNNGEIRNIRTKNIVIATGSTSARLPIEGSNNPQIFNNKTLLDFNKVSKSLFIIGGGVIGMEFANIFNEMGSEVTVAEFMPAILQQVDEDLIKRYKILAKKRGIHIHTSVKINKIEKDEKEFIITGENKDGEVIFKSEDVLLAAGRTPNLRRLNIEEMGINFDKKGIKVDERYMTNIPGIYAVGDVNGISMLAHSGSYQGIQVAERIMGNEDTLILPPIPSCIFVFPEISSVGITEKEAKDKGIKYKTSKFMFGGNGKALAMGEEEGLIKIIADSEDDTILGVHIMGAHASDLIHEGMIAVYKKMKCSEFSHTIHALPTLSEVLSEAIMTVNKESIYS